MKFIVQILRLAGDEPPHVLHAFTHTASSIHMVRAAMIAVIKSPQWPSEANGFRIVTEDGTELYRWPE